MRLDFYTISIVIVLLKTTCLRKAQGLYLSVPCVNGIYLEPAMGPTVLGSVYSLVTETVSASSLQGASNHNSKSTPCK